MSNFSHHKLFSLADRLESKYYGQLQKSAVFGGYIGRGYSGTGHVSGIGSNIGSSETEFTKINDFVIKTIPEFELFLKNIVPVLKQIKKDHQKALKRSELGENDLEGLAAMNDIDWQRGQPIPEELETVMLSATLSGRLDPVSKFFTKIASSDPSIAFKLALANRHLSMFERLKGKAKSFFGKKEPEFEDEPETQSMMSPGLDISLERKKTFELKELLKDIMPYVDSFIASYKDFLNKPTIVKLDNLLEEAGKFEFLLAPVKTQVKQLQEFVSPSQETIESLFFEEEGLEEGKSAMTSMLSYLMRDPELSNPLNVKRALKLHRMLGEKLKNLGAL